MKDGVGFTSARTRDRLIAQLQQRGIGDERVLKAIREVPRHRFIDKALETKAYDDDALPIGHKQTISQPYIVALMTEAILRGAPQRVLEIGTGSGYQTAVLAKLVPQLYTVERIRDLTLAARERLGEMDILNVEMKLDDGHLGWEERAPFDAILITAAPERVPTRLFKQLEIGGRMVVPVGAERESQKLLELIRTGEDTFDTHELCEVRFVPLVRGAA